jgi:anthranilate phosphoribosyltransferase
MLGPMVNPSFPKFQMVGVFSLELARMYAYLYQKTETKYAILHGLEGFDEVSLTDNVKIITNSTETINSPEDFLFDTIQLSEIKGGNTIEDSAKIFHKILSGNGSEAQNNVVLVNSALAIQTISELSYTDALEKAKESLYNKNALQKLNTLIKLSK